MIASKLSGHPLAALAMCVMVLSGCETMPGPGEIVCGVIKAPFEIARALDQSPKSRPPIQQPGPAQRVWQTAGVRSTTTMRSSRTDSLPIISVPPPVVGSQADDHGSEEILSRMWNSYEAFDYQGVIEQTRTLIERPQSSPAQRAKAYIMAGASCYVLNNPSAAYTCLQKATKEDPAVRPNPNLLPSEICRIHASILSQQ